MDDSEMTTMWDFLTDSNLDEILDDKVTSADAAANFLETAIVKIEPSVVTFQWDESSVASFTSSEDMSSVASFNSDEEAEVPLLPHQLRRQRQRVYDKTYRSKAKGNRAALIKAFVAGLKLLNILLEDRVERTRMVIATMRLVSLNKERQTASDHEIDQQTVDQEVRKQLLLNEKAMKYINAWTVTWQNTKEENGKYFLKDIAADIDKRSNDLERLGEGLKEASAELEWCSQQK